MRCGKAAWIALLWLCVVIQGVAAQDVSAPDPTPGQAYAAERVYDFTQNCKRQAVSLRVKTVSTGRQKALGFERRVIYQHPLEPGQESVLSFPVALPSIRQDEHLFFRSYVAIKDGFLGTGERPLKDGVTFSVGVNSSQKLFSMLRDDCGWRPIALNLSSYAGTSVTVELIVHPNRVITSDWALWGDPMLVKLKKTKKLAAQPLIPFAALSELPAPQSEGIHLFRLSSASCQQLSATPGAAPLYFFTAFSDILCPQSGGLDLPGDWKSSSEYLCTVVPLPSQAK
jgi:hypothetical protein